MRARRSSLVAACAAAALGILSVVIAPSAAALPTACGDVSLAVPVPPSSGGEQDALIQQANILVERDELEPAERLYGLALEGTPADARAGQGIAHIEARRQAARDAVEAAEGLAESPPTGEAAADAAAADIEACYEKAIEFDPDNASAAEALAAETDEGTAATRATDRWDAFYKGWVAPAVDLLLPALAVLAVLLVLARMVTARVVPVDAQEWAGRQVAWWTGLALLVATAVFACALATSPDVGATHVLWRPGALVVIAALAVLALWVLHSSGRDVHWASRVSAVVVVVVALVVGFLAMVVLEMLSTDSRAWLWALAVVVAGLGVLLVAAGRGHALRLLIQVKRGEKADPTGAAYVLGRLHELGSSPPQGLKTPQQVDVSDLPISALSSLPGGRFAEPLTRLVGLVSASVPWRAIVEDGQADGLLVVTLTRNGVVAQTAVIDAAGFLPEPPDEAEEPSRTAGDEATDGEKDASGVDRGDLLTAASAVIITELAERHPRLRVGLCGARSWESVAAHVVGTKPPASEGGKELRRELLAYAVQADPGNALAQLAYVNELAKGTHDIGPMTAHAQRLETLRETVARQAEDEERANEHEQRERGYLPLQLRLAHTLTATRLNIAASGEQPADLSDVFDAAAEYAHLCSLLARAERTFIDRGRRRFLGELVLVAAELKLAVAALFQERGLVRPLLDPPPLTPDLAVKERRAAGGPMQLRERAALHMALGLHAAAALLRPTAGASVRAPDTTAGTDR